MTASSHNGYRGGNGGGGGNSPRPVIGICAPREPASWSVWTDQLAHVVADSYVTAVQSTGSHALLLPIHSPAATELLDRIDGLVLAGGSDIDPTFYGAAIDPATEETFPDRDAFEIAMAREALKRQLPVLGICRGMQVLNVVCGGTLRQDITEGHPSPHRRSFGSFDDAENEIRLEPDSLAAKALGEDIHIGHCHHHQSVDRLGDGLVVTGRMVVDGAPEAIEAAGDGWVLGVQWHPEASERRELFQALANAARDHASTRA